MNGLEVDEQAIMTGVLATTSGLPDGPILIRFAEAMVGEDGEPLAIARAEIRAVLGEAALVDTAAVASNFERMVRIADATGIPLDVPTAALTSDLRDELGIDRFASALNTPPVGTLQRMLALVGAPVLTGVLRLVGRWRRWKRPRHLAP